jgi:uncharacterized protein YybS (DUF2232 family)
MRTILALDFPIRGVTMKKKNVLFEVVLTIAGFAALIFFSCKVPILPALTIWLLPIPLMYAGSKWGWRGALALLLPGAVFVLTIQPNIGALIPAMMMLTGFVMGVVLGLKKSAFSILTAGTLANVTMLILLLAISIRYFQFNPIVEMKTAIGHSFDTAVAEAQPFLTQDTGELKDLMKEELDFLGYLAPSLIVLVGFLYAFIVALIGLPALRKLGAGAPHWRPLRSLQVPKSLMWIYLCVLLVVTFGQLEAGTPLFIVSVNLVFVLEMVLAFQGIGFIFYVAYVRGIPKVIPTLTTIVVVMFGFLLIRLAAILGMIDLMFNLRSRLTKKG